jgi:hypothetical protein
MNSRRRLFFYILVNIFLSAMVTGTILYFYNRLYQKNCNATLPDATLAIGSPDETAVAIIGINGTGALADEAVTIQNTGNSTLVLTGWALKNNLGAAYTFPELTLFPGGMVELHTKSGSNTASDLYWQRSASVWSSGELAALYDTQNIARAFYRVP